MPSVNNKGQVQLIAYPSQERGNANLGWLKAFHSFSFATPRKTEHLTFGCLRVLNEDRVEPSTGFGTHAHREFEIFSYIIAGESLHQDSMDNKEILKRGDIQMTSAGTGIRHSEHTHGTEHQVHLIQVWSEPSIPNLTPQYFTRHFTDEEKMNKWAMVVAPIDYPSVTEARAAPGPAPIHSPLSLLATLVSPAHIVSHTVERSKAFIQVLQTSGYNTGEPTGASVRVTVGGEETTLREGDAAYVHLPVGTEVNVENVGDRVAEVLLFDLE